MKKKIITFVLIVLGFLALSYAYVPQVLGGKIVNQGDISGYKGMSQEKTQWDKAHPDDPALWSDSMFGGMPTIAYSIPKEGDWTQKIYDFLLLGKRPATYFFISLLGSFLLMLALGIHPLIALGGAIAVTFCSYNMQIIQVGHNTKMQALAFLPWVLASVVFTYRRSEKEKKWLPLTIFGGSLFAVALSLQIKANHPQISYYLAILILIYAVYALISAIKGKRFKRFICASAVLLVTGLLGIATNANKLIPTWEYTEYSMRGGNKSTGGDSKGLDLDYATAWSYGWEELPNMMIPNFNGGSSSGKVNPKRSSTYNLLKQVGQTDLKEVCNNLPLYWGPQPFTAGPMYMGAVTMFLFILGLFCYRGKDKWWIIVATVLAIFLALGSHFLWFTKFFYNYVPLYNKFRTVSMALVVLQFTLPMLGFLTLDRMVKDDDSALLVKKKSWIALAITAGFCFVCIVAPSIAGSFTGAVDEGQPDILVGALCADRVALLRSDALRSLLFICASWLILLWGTSVPETAAKTFSSQKQSRIARRTTASLALCALVILDLLPAGKRYLSSEDFVSERQFNTQFKIRPVDQAILEDSDPSYRVLDLTVNVFNDSHPSYWHKNVGGYSPAKLQIYQNFIDSKLSSEIAKVYRSLQDVKTLEEAENALPYLDALASLNCRYVIINGNAAPIRYRFAKGAAWFESGSGQIEMKTYTPNRLEYHYACTEDSKAVFSEVYYPAGWKLRLADSGEELEIEKYGDVFRSATLPAGERDIIMSFEPDSFKKGVGISRATSIILILLVLGTAFVTIWK